MSRAELRFRDLFLLLQDSRRGHHCLLFSSLYSLPAWFSQIRKPGFSFAGPDHSSLLPSHIKSHRRVFIQGNLCRESPPWSLWSTGFVLSQLHAAEKLLSVLSPAQRAVPAPAVLSPLLPALGSLHCLHPGHVPALLQVAHGIPWSCNPTGMIEAAPLSLSTACGADSCQQLDKTNTSKQRHFSSYYFFLAFGNKLRGSRGLLLLLTAGTLELPGRSHYHNPSLQ